MTSKIATLVTAVMALGLFAGSAMAQSYPASIAGTWTAQANQSVLTIVITQGTTGACRALSGTFDTTNIAGFYCPRTGRFNIARNDPTTGVTIQYYSGNVSQTGSHLFMGGIFGVPTAAGGPLGEYNFSAIK